MSVERIEEYKQVNGVHILKVYCKPTKAFPEGNNLFYAPSEAINLVKKYAWFLGTYGKHSVYIIAHDNSTYHYDTIQFHAKFFEFYQGYKWQGSIDHINLIEIDNIDCNLNAVNQMQNGFNKLTRGYIFDTRIKPAIFQIKINIDGKYYYPYKSVRNEADACSVQNYAEQVWLRETLGSQYYMFDFKKCRRGSQYLLDLERTGQISEEEATYRHIMRYADNAWYYLRYGLQDYFKQYHIPVPQYNLDAYGFMVHPITGQKLCPF